MRWRFLLTGALAAGLALFVWQFVSHAALPWHDPSFREFADAEAVTSVLAANAPEPGVYMATSGVFAAVRIDPAIPDRTQEMGATLARQFALNVISSLALAFLIAGAARKPPLIVAARVAGLGLAAGMLAYLSLWNWHGIGPAFAIVNTIDFAIGFGIVGLVLGWLANRMLRVDGAQTGGEARARVATTVG